MIRFKKVSVWLSVVLICMMLGGYLVATTARSDNKEEKESVALSDAKAGFASEEDVGSSQQTQQGSTDIDGYFLVGTIDGEDVELWHEKCSGIKTQLRIGGQYYPLELDIDCSNYGTVELLSDDYDDDGSKEYAIFTSNLGDGCGRLYVIEIDGGQTKVAEFGESDLYEQIKDADDMKLISAERCFVHWCFIRTPTRDFFENGSFQVDAVLRTEESGKGKISNYFDHAGDITAKLRYREDGSFVFESAEFTIREGYLKQKVLDMFSAQELQKVTKQLGPEDAHDFSPEETGVDDIRIIAKSSGDDACLYGIYAKDGGATVLRVGDQVYPTGMDGWTDCQNGYLVRLNRYEEDASERNYVLIWQRASDGDTMVSYFAVGRGYIWIPLLCSGSLLAESPRKQCALYCVSVDRVGEMTLLRRQDMWFQADQETDESINWYELTTDEGIKDIDKDCRGCNELWTYAAYWSKDDHERCWCSPLLLNHKKLGVIEHTTKDRIHISWYEPERMPNESEYEYFSIDENYQGSETRSICYKKNCYAADGSFEGSAIGYVACHNGTFSCFSPLQSDLVLKKTYDLGGEGNRENMYCEYYESTTSWESVYCIVKNEKVVLRFFEQTKGGGSVNLADIDEDGQKELIIIHGWWGSNYNPVSFRVFKEQEDGQWRILDCPGSLPVGMRMDANGKDGIIFCTGLDKTIIADLDCPMANAGELCTQVGGPEPFEVEMDSREGKTCLKAKFHLEILGGTKFDVIGIATVYFNYDEQGEIHILDLEGQLEN